MDFIKSYNLLTCAFIFLIIILALVGALLIYLEDKDFEEEAKQQCKRLNMNVFDSEKGSAFSTGSITCIDKTTGEIKKIR